jgi:NAD(P)-dependent dehydrogenase (short-subunit alcohol dehydrogenase family)
MVYAMPSQPLLGKHALVTGASRGIGAAIARTLSTAGANVSLLVRDASKGATVAATLATPHAVVVADIRDADALTSAVHAATHALGPVDILVNNAGTARSMPFLKSESALFQQMFDEHVLAVVHASQAVLPGMLERGQGAIVNIASVAGLWGAPYITAYTAAKHAMVGLTRALAAEVGPRGVAVNAVCPGYTDTDLVAGAVSQIVARTGRTAQEAEAMILADAKQSRFVSVDEVATAVLMLCTNADATAGGQTVVLTGAEDA